LDLDGAATTITKLDMHMRWAMLTRVDGDPTKRELFNLRHRCTVVQSFPYVK